jgi:hypothetical protein
MFVSCTVFVLLGRGLCDGPIPRPEESYRLWCVSECDQMKIKTLYACCEQVGRRGKDCETKRCLNLKLCGANSNRCASKSYVKVICTITYGEISEIF